MIIGYRIKQGGLNRLANDLQNCKKIFNILSHWGNANLSYFDTLLNFMSVRKANKNNIKLNSKK